VASHHHTQGSNFRDGALFIHLSRTARAKEANEFRARDIAKIVNALARVGVWDESLFRKMSTVVRGMSADSLPLRDAARIVCAFTLAQVCSNVTSKFTIETKCGQ